ncbi:MAG: ATP-dependent DNA helicase [Alphaproteobacteria bacterium]
MPDINDVLAARLNPEQRVAASDAAAEVLTLACAGSGKSRTLAYRIAWLIAAQGARPEQIVAFTFTEKAADSIKQRVASALAASGLDPNALGKMYIGTIHSYCQFLLGQMDARYRQFEVLDENRIKLYLMSRYGQLGLHNLRNAMRQHLGRATVPGYFETVTETAEAWILMKEELIDPPVVAQHNADLGAVLADLQTSLDTDEYIDFASMQRIVVDALRANDPRILGAIEDLEHLLVDEYQDINPVQDELINLLHAASSTLFVVGDDDQSIYGWRGADVSRIIEFQQTHPQSSRHTIGTNYRSTSAIVTAADDFIAAELGAGRIPKNPQAAAGDVDRDARVLWFDDRDNEVDFVVSRIQSLLGGRYIENDEEGTVRGLTPADIAILMQSTRMNEPNGGPPRHAAFTDALEQAGIPYSLEAGGGLFERPHVQTMRNAFELFRNGNPDRAAVRDLFDTNINPVFPNADFGELVNVMARWGRRIHTAVAAGQARQRLYPQQLVYDLLEAFRVSQTPIDHPTMQDIGVFSRIMQDVETVYMSVDTANRFTQILNFLQVLADRGYNTSSYEVSQRPDAVTVSTIHKMKGLEFPVVFVVDVENQRFPKRRRGYEKWLPAELVQGSLDKGSYQSTREEQARLFYTAVTRAERYLYVTGSAQNGWVRRALRTSPFAARLQHAEIHQDPIQPPFLLPRHPSARRLEEANLPTTYSDIKYYLRCPKDYQFRKVYGFSPPVPDLFGFGMTVHAAIGRIHAEFVNQPPTEHEAAAIAEDIFHVKHVPQARDPVNRPGPYERAQNRAVELVTNYTQDFAEDFVHRRQVEARFEIPSGNTVISGAIDLMIHENEAGDLIDACVVDFKTMEGGENPIDSDTLEWTELALQVQLYARAARDVLLETADQGHVHLLKDNQRIEVPVNDVALDAALDLVQWAVNRIIAEDFPMRPHQHKCGECDFRQICAQVPEDFGTNEAPPSISVPGGQQLLPPAFRFYEPN